VFKVFHFPKVVVFSIRIWKMCWMSKQWFKRQGKYCLS